EEQALDERGAPPRIPPLRSGETRRPNRVGRNSHRARLSETARSIGEVLRRRKFARLITTERRSPCARSCAPWWRARTRCPPGASGGCSRRQPDAGRRRAARPEEEVDVPAARKPCFATRRCGRGGLPRRAPLA